MSASSDEAENVFFGAFAPAAAAAVGASLSSSSSCEPVESADARAAATARGRVWGRNDRRKLLLLLLLRTAAEGEVSVRGAAETAAAAALEKGEEKGRAFELSLRVASSPAPAPDRSETALTRPREGKSPVERAGPEKVAREGGSIAFDRPQPLSSTFFNADAEKKKLQRCSLSACFL
jgi:hypothetical protein